jgi:hypothetical protein
MLRNRESECAVTVLSLKPLARRGIAAAHGIGGGPSSDEAAAALAT